MPAMLRARNREEEPLRASTYQYHPDLLLYQLDTLWHIMPAVARSRNIRTLLPTDARAGWAAIVARRIGAGNEGMAEAATCWIVDHGASHGFRVPNVRERARVMGMEPYLEQLELSEFDTYQAEGNSFDRIAVAVRIDDAIG